jgi:hypothetical protein
MPCDEAVYIIIWPIIAVRSMYFLRSLAGRFIPSSRRRSMFVTTQIRAFSGTPSSGCSVVQEPGWFRKEPTCSALVPRDDSY